MGEVSTAPPRRSSSDRATGASHFQYAAHPERGKNDAADFDCGVSYYIWMMRLERTPHVVKRRRVAP